jgi:hypothetical protein
VDQGQPTGGILCPGIGAHVLADFSCGLLVINRPHRPSFLADPAALYASFGCIQSGPGRDAGHQVGPPRSQSVICQSALD